MKEGEDSILDPTLEDEKESLEKPTKNQGGDMLQVDSLGKNAKLIRKSVKRR